MGEDLVPFVKCSLLMTPVDRLAEERAPQWPGNFNRNFIPKSSTLSAQMENPLIVYRPVQRERITVLDSKLQRSGMVTKRSLRAEQRGNRSRGLLRTISAIGSSDNRLRVDHET